MAISGLVLTLTDDDAQRAQAMLSLAALPELDLGDLAGLRLPVVADTPDRRADRDLFERLQAMPGVLFADVAYVWFDVDPAAHEAAPHDATPHEAAATPHPTHQAPAPDATGSRS